MANFVVKFYSISSGQGRQVGSVTWDGKRLRAEGDQVEDLIDIPVHHDQGTPIPPSKEPERFLKALQYVYRSPYFYAGAMEEVA